MQPQDPPNNDPYSPRPQTPHYVPHHGQQQNQAPAPQPQPYQQPPVPQQPAVYGQPVAYQPAQAQPTDPTGHQQTYDFIMNPQKPVRTVSFPGASSLLGRVAVVGGGLIVLLILFSVVKGFLQTSPNKADFVSVAQSQQAVLHLADNALQQQTLSTTNQNFAITTQAGLGSEQSELFTYLKSVKIKVNDKEVALKISAATDQRLTTAAAASTYDSTFKEAAQAQLNEYMQALKTAYVHNTGPRGRALLNKDYDSAQLLLQQLDSASN